jgi:hypothetical protein
MPSHFAHLIFAEEALNAAFGDAGKDILEAHGNILRFAAQGPDFFYHNQRTMPTGLRYGVITHRGRYGTLVENMTREALRLNATPSSELAAFIYGYATHAPLDRKTHPYIGYRAGWVDPEKPETKKYFHCHPFLERILDVLVLKEKRGLDLAQFDFVPQVYCGKTLPYGVIKILVKSLNSTYPSLSFKSRDRRRVENAYRDTIFFFKLTNHRNPLLTGLAFRKDRKERFQEKRLALLHPSEIPAGYDFLNNDHAPWRHPCDGESSNASFMELYEAALRDAVESIRSISDVLARKKPPDLISEAVGEQSLDTGRENCIPKYSEPFPLSEMLQAMYDSMELSFQKR